MPMFLAFLGTRKADYYYVRVRELRKTARMKKLYTVNKIEGREKRALFNQS